MAKNLHAIIKLQKWEVDEKRRALGEMMRYEEAILTELKRLEEELKKEQKIASESPIAALTYGAYAKKHISNREEAEKALEEIQKRIKDMQDIIAEEFQKLKTYEIVQQNRDKREEEERNRKEQITLDEIGMTLHRRKKDGSDDV